GGTLFLDEIGDLPLNVQAAFLRVLQESEVVPVGGQHPESLDLRVIAATHRDLKAMVREGTFRHDLLARLEGVTLELPPLRDRPEDVPVRLTLLLRKLAPERPHVTLTPAAAHALLTQDRPLNIRELEQALAGSLALSGVGAIDLPHLPRTVIEAPEPVPARQLSAAETRHREELTHLLSEHGGNVT